MLKAGASGYILKGAETKELINAVRVVSKGEVFLHSAMAQRLVQDYLHRTSVASQPGPSLSARETEILQLIAEGFSSKEIAEKLVISPSTVYTHRNNIMSKLELSSRHELIQYARKHGFISDF
jgi:two-component system response regulator NreC